MYLSRCTECRDHIFRPGTGRFFRRCIGGRLDFGYPANEHSEASAYRKNRNVQSEPECQAYCLVQHWRPPLRIAERVSDSGPLSNSDMISIWSEFLEPDQNHATKSLTNPKAAGMTATLRPIDSASAVLHILVALPDLNISRSGIAPSRPRVLRCYSEGLCWRSYTCLICRPWGSEENSEMERLLRLKLPYASIAAKLRRSASERGARVVPVRFSCPRARLGGERIAVRAKP